MAGATSRAILCRHCVRHRVRRWSSRAGPAHVRAHAVDNRLVSQGEQPGIVDTSTLRMREATITTGVWLTYLVGGLGEIYVALTWDRPNRPALAVLFAMAVMAGIG